MGRPLDRWSKPRLTALTRGAGVIVAGVALIGADGVLALLVISFSAGTFYLLIRQLARLTRLLALTR